MRLLNIYSLQFQEFFESEIPNYHILSHRWSRDEISYEEFCCGRVPDKAGYHKVVAFCRFIRHRREDGLISRKAVDRLGAQRAAVADDMSDLAANDFQVHLKAGQRLPFAGGEWVWVDTCCIDKRSSAELTEAINTMFKWYAGSYECIVQLADVPSWRQFGMAPPYQREETNDDWMYWTKYGTNYKHLRSGRPQDVVQSIMDGAIASLQRSVWFTRGWTLQELLAPEIVVFCNSDWEVVGHVCKRDTCTRNMHAYGMHLTDIISNVTGIPKRYLGGEEPMYNASIAQRMSWASRRTTTRTEDEAYCLLGLFNVNMTMIYGEGRKAFRRLQLEIIQRSTDQSVFAWIQGEGVTSIFAPSPTAFAASGQVTLARKAGKNPYSITNNGLQLRAKLYHPSNMSTVGKYVRLIRLACRDHDGHRVVIALEKGYDRYFRFIPSPPSTDQGDTLKVGKLLDERTIFVDTGVEDTVVPGSTQDVYSSGSD